MASSLELGERSAGCRRVVRSRRARADQWRTPTLSTRARHYFDFSLVWHAEAVRGRPTTASSDVMQRLKPALVRPESASTVGANRIVVDYEYTP